MIVVLLEIYGIVLLFIQQYYFFLIGDLHNYLLFAVEGHRNSIKHSEII